MRPAVAKSPADRPSTGMRAERFVRDALTLATGGALAQSLSFAIAPILARLYAPDDFGLFSIYAFTLGVFAAVVCWAYEAAVVLPKEDREARDLVVLSIV